MQSNKRKSFIFIGLSALLAACLLVHIAPPMEGIIVDAETGDPIPDAALLVAWRRFGLHGGGVATHQMCEIVADSHGKFSIGPRFSIGFQPTAFQDMLIGTAATGYVSDTLLLTPSDPYVSAQTNWWGLRSLTVKIESNDFNMRSLARVAESKEVSVFPPQYFSNGQYNTMQRANGHLKIVAPELAFGLSAQSRYKYENFWQRTHSFRQELKKGADGPKPSPQRVTCL